VGCARRGAAPGGNGITSPDDIRSLADLRRLPFTPKIDLREHYPFGLFAVPVAQLVRIHGSSGTRGKPTIVVWSGVPQKGSPAEGFTAQTREHAPVAIPASMLQILLIPLPGTLIRP
jgi:hypothetical protein